MSGRMARSKGQRGEREVIAILQPVIDRVYAEEGLQGVALKRNLMQSMEGGFDLVGLHWMALEVKRVENQSGLGTWWRQTVQQAARGETPVLLYRPNNAKWKCRMRVPVRCGARGCGTYVQMTVDTTIDDFLVYFEYRVRAEVQGMKERGEIKVESGVQTSFLPELPAWLKQG